MQRFSISKMSAFDSGPAAASALPPDISIVFAEHTNRADKPFNVTPGRYRSWLWNKEPKRPGQHGSHASLDEAHPRGLLSDRHPARRQLLADFVAKLLLPDGVSDVDE